MFDEGRKGTLEYGKLAVVVLSADFMNLSMLSLVQPALLHWASNFSSFTFCSCERLSFA